VLCALVGLSALLLLAYVVMPLAYLLRSDPMPMRGLLLLLVHVFPALAYLWALWAVQRALRDMAAGRLFQPVVAAALRQIGVGVMIGALLNIFAVTNLTRVIAHTRGGFAYFDLSGMVLVIIGAALVLLARVVEQASQLQRELDEIV
jgi:hypothetical protein